MQALLVAEVLAVMICRFGCVALLFCLCGQNGRPSQAKRQNLTGEVWQIFCRAWTLTGHTAKPHRPHKTTQATQAKPYNQRRSITAQTAKPHTATRRLASTYPETPLDGRIRCHKLLAVEDGRALHARSICNALLGLWLQSRCSTAKTDTVTEYGRSSSCAAEGLERFPTATSSSI